MLESIENKRYWKMEQVYYLEKHMERFSDCSREYFILKREAEYIRKSIL